MSSYNKPQSYSSGGGGSAPQANKNSFKKGLGFVPNSICRSPTDPIKELLNSAPAITKGVCATSEMKLAIGESNSTIPLFHLEQIVQANEEERGRLLQALGIALTQVGFIGIHAKNLIPLITQAQKEMKKYFAQPFENKILNWKAGKTHHGFSHKGQEKAPNAAGADIKECFSIPRGFNDWPRHSSSFSRVMGEYYSILSQYANRLSEYIMEYLGQTEEIRDFDERQNILRLIYYPPIRPDDDPKAMWAAPNFDRNFLTILSPGTTPSLQFRTNQDRWQHVVVPDGYLIVNAGYQLQHKTAGLIKTRLQRVVNLGGPYTRLERFSTAFSSSLPGNASLKPFENCVELITREMTGKEKTSYLRKYPDIAVRTMQCDILQKHLD